MTEGEAREALYQCWRALWGDDGAARTPWALGDETFDPPNGPWVRFSVRHTNRQQTSLGAPRNRKFTATGTVFVQYFQPPAAEQDVADGHLEAIKGMEARSLPGTTIKLQAAIPRELGVVEGGSWWAARVDIPFTYETVK